MQRIIIAVAILLTTYSCSYIGAGSLGSFQSYYFEVSESEMDLQIQKLYSDIPQFIIPEKWEQFDNWSERGFGSLKGKIFYFEEKPEEMFFITYYQLDEKYTIKEGFPTTDISVRAVHNGLGRWKTVEDFNDDKPELKRIENRFYNEIILRLEKRINTTALKKNHGFSSIWICRSAISIAS